MLKELLQRKPITPQSSPLRRALTTADLIFMGIGIIIGAGVFVLTGIAAATKAGPAVVISYFISGIVAMFAALSYAELAASIGGSGSAYSYAYAGLGELIAWIIGWNLLLEYGMAVSAVAIGWAAYVQNLFQSIGITLPHSFLSNPFEGGIVNLFAVLIIVLITLLSCLGVKQSARMNGVIVVIKLIVIAVFIIVSISDVDFKYWHNFVPFGWHGIMEGAALVFFAYIGFDALSTAVEEAIDPQRSIPIAITVSLIVCTLIYILVSALLTTITSYTTLNVASPVAQTMLNLGHHLAAGVIAAGAIAGLTTVILVSFYALSRIILAMARDGLLPLSIAKINDQTHSPIRIIVLIGLITSVIAGFSPIDRAAELVNIGTLAAFTFVCIGVILFRYSHPELKRPFKLPFNPVIPLLGVISCLYLMIYLPSITWWRFIIWTLIGIIIYFMYGQRHSVLRRTA